MKLVGRRSASVIVVCVYRPPGTVSSQCTEQLSDMFDQLTLLDTPFVVVGDFNAPGVIAGGELHHHVTDVFARYGSDCCSTSLFRRTLTATFSTSFCHRQMEEVPQLVSTVSVQSVCFSDHHLLICQIGVPPTPPVKTTHTYRPLKKMDKEAFCRDILQSTLFAML